MRVVRYSEPPSAGIVLAAVAATLLTIGGCTETEEAQAQSDPLLEQERTGTIFDPREGETWKYRVHKEIPNNLQLSDTDAARFPEPTESGQRVTFNRTRTCRGKKEFDAPESGPEITSIEISEGPAILGEELYEISVDGVLSAGWVPADSDTPEDYVLTEAIPLAVPKMEAGQVWEGVGLDPARTFLFRVIERAQVTVPAGTFDAARIQITSDHFSNDDEDVMTLKRTVWFAENVGIVKEEVVSYDSQKVLVRESAELIHWVIPSEDEPSGATIVTTEDRLVPEPNDTDEPVEIEPAIEDPVEGADNPEEPQNASGDATEEEARTESEEETEADLEDDNASDQDSDSTDA